MHVERAALRDAEARTVDKPPFFIAHNQALIDAAARFDKGERVELPHLRGGRARRFFAAAESALHLPETEWPQPIRRPRLRRTPAQDRRIAELKKKRDAAAAALDLEPSLIAPKASIEAIVFERDDARLMSWQRFLLGLDEGEAA